jgi:hypothetical protein
MSDKDTFDNA